MKFMGKFIRVFKSFAEQELFHLERMAGTTVEERFSKLFLMRKMNTCFHPAKESARKLIIKKWTSDDLMALKNKPNKKD